MELARIHYSADTRLWEAKWGVEWGMAGKENFACPCVYTSI